MSPSGKAKDCGSFIRGFNSHHPPFKLIASLAANSIVSNELISVIPILTIVTKRVLGQIARGEFALLAVRVANLITQQLVILNEQSEAFRRFFARSQNDNFFRLIYSHP